MHHVAILSKTPDFLEKIISGEKTIESRWYKFKRDPWNKIKKEDIVYFKKTGLPVSAKAKVSKVLQFDLGETSALEILKKYGKQIYVINLKDSLSAKVGKNYCILVFLKDVKPVKPFNINKKGFGLMSAWLCVDNIDRIKTRFKN